jgi:hypothetical protein
MQNLAPSGVSDPQCGHRIDRLSCTVAQAAGGDGEESSHPPLLDLSWMVCHYSTRRLVSSGKRDRALDHGAAEGGDDTSDIATGAVMAVRSHALSELLTVITRGAYAAHMWRSRSSGRWSV